MKRFRLLVLAGVATASLLLASPGRAALPVFDVAVFGQNVIEAARMLEEISNQVTQIQQFVSMLEYDARNVAALSFSSLPQLNQAIGRITGLMNQAQGIIYDTQQVDQQFQQYYPANYTLQTSDAQLVQDARTRWDYSLASFRQAMEVQSQIVQDLSSDQQQMNDLVGQSQDAQGILQATQAGNQILALQSKQLAATQALLASGARAQALEQARQAAAEEQAHEQFQRFLGTPIPYTPTPVQAFH